MSRLIIVEPMALAAIASSRGTGVANLSTPDPKEVWADDASGSPVTLTIDLGSVRFVDTVFLGHVRPPAADATWSITGGAGGSGEQVIQTTTTLRVPDGIGATPKGSHALFFGARSAVRYLAITMTQPAGSPPLTTGVVVIGEAFVAELGPEWGAGRRPIDTGTATSLPSGGFSIVEGARKLSYGWTFGDLSYDETDRLERIALELGQTRPGLVIEDPARTAGLRERIRYGLFQQWRQFERRNRRQTRWEIGIEDWI